MPRKIIDISGQTFGQITVVSFSGKDKFKRAMFLCRCSCGTEKILAGIELRSGHAGSCGCARVMHAKKVSEGNVKHGHSRRSVISRTRTSWHMMLQRCTNPSATGFSNYGGKGVSVCERWQLFENFLFDMGERPVKTTLGRFRDTGNYEPGNVKWMTRQEQLFEAFKKKKNVSVEKLLGDEKEAEYLWAITENCYAGVEIPSKEFFKQCCLTGDVFVVFVTDGPVGYALVNEQSSCSPLLRSIAVLPKFRKKGLGELLLSTISKCYKEAGATSILLHCKVNNRAFVLYFDAGYRVRAYLRNYYAPEGDGLEMEKKL